MEGLHELDAFRVIFPSDKEIERLKAGAAFMDSSNEAIEQIVIRYRHQEYGRNRIC